MSIAKTKIAIGLVIILAVLAISNVFAANIIMNMTASYNGKTLAYEEEIKLKNTDTNRTLTAITDAKFVDSSLTIYYTMGKGTRTVVSTGKKSASLEIPNNLTPGTSYWIGLEAVSNNVADNYVGNSNIFYVKVTCPQETTPTTTIPTTPAPATTTAAVSLKNDEGYINAGSTLNRKTGDKLLVVAESNKGIIRIGYKWNGGTINYISGSEGYITVPSGQPDEVLKLELTAETTDNKWAPAKSYNVRLPKQSTPSSKGYVVVKYNGNQLTDGQYPISVNSNTIEVELSGNPASDFSQIVYTVNNGRSEEVANPKGQKVKIELEPGQTKTLQVYGLYTDNTQTEVSKYIFVYEYVPENDDLIIEDWMKENKEADGLLVSLRNDSDEYEKKNKNMYALGEEVVYYVDYKNAGKDINQEVRLVLELPLEFDVVNSYGGTVDKEKKTITWTMKDGLEKGEAGTKIVKIEYTSLGKSSRKSDTVYPSAKIYQGTSKSPKDISTVINFIFKDEDTEIQDDHYPYMYGDADKNTFRPDDTIKRAEGALVLARIFGINYSGTQVIGNEYSDLDETYLEAQKAIVASKKLGIINGYPDGSFRPNAKMTKAEFIKIIAAYVEKKAEEDEIKGLEIKDEENAIKLYKNATNVYVTGNSTQDAHWAISYVTLLTRINMTPVNGSRKTIALDDEITRAEVAQLVNFYLFRAPAEGGKTNFSDVSKSHKLFADIVEATRPVHSYTLTSEGTEVAVKD